MKERLWIYFEFDLNTCVNTQLFLLLKAGKASVIDFNHIQIMIGWFSKQIQIAKLIFIVYCCQATVYYWTTPTNLMKL